MILLRAIDVESTGLTPEDKIVEIGFCSVRFDGVVETPSTLVEVDTKYESAITNPHRPIDIEALATHHITDEEAATGMEIDKAIECMIGPADILVAHNAKFERQFIKTEKPVICTYKVALYHASHAPSHSLQVLRYWLKLNVDPVMASPPHRAGPDAFVTAALVARMLAKIPIAEMIDISSRPALLPKFRFGEHQGKPLVEVPKSYLQWILTKDFDEDVKYTASHYLKL